MCGVQLFSSYFIDCRSSVVAHWVLSGFLRRLCSHRRQLRGSPSSRRTASPGVQMDSNQNFTQTYLKLKLSVLRESRVYDNGTSCYQGNWLPCGNFNWILKDEWNLWQSYYWAIGPTSEEAWCRGGGGGHGGGVAGMLSTDEAAEVRGGAMDVLPRMLVFIPEATGKRPWVPSRTMRWLDVYIKRFSLVWECSKFMSSVKSMLLGDNARLCPNLQEEENRILQPWFGLLFVTSHSACP